MIPLQFKCATPGNETSAARGSGIVYDDPAGKVVAQTAVDMGHMLPRIALGLNYCEPLADALEAILKAFAEPHYGDLSQQADSVFDAIEKTGARALIDQYRKDSAPE